MTKNDGTCSAMVALALYIVTGGERQATVAEACDAIRQMRDMFNRAGRKVDEMEVLMDLQAKRLVDGAKVTHVPTVDPTALALMQLIWGLPDETPVSRLRELIVAARPSQK